MKKLFRFLVIFACRIINPRLKYLVFESYPECEGSPRAIYDEIKKNNFDKRYKLVWFVNKSYSRNDFMVFPAFGKLSFKDKILKEFILFQTKLIVDSNRPIPKRNPKTFRLYTRHGGPLKRVPDYTNKLGKMDYVLTLSDSTKNLDFIDYKGYCCDNLSQVLPLGFPANDKILNYSKEKQNLFYEIGFSKTKYKKIIGWLPTVRQNKTGRRKDSSVIFRYGIPLIYSKESFTKLNSFLEKRDILLVVQLHHAQEKNFIIEKFSNIFLVSDEFKNQKKINFIEMLCSFDALITDYSSVYYEFLLLNRPIALSIDDFDSYTKNTALYIDYFDWIKGVYLKNFSDLTQFIDMVANGIDIAKEEREKSMHRVHKYIDNQSTKRVVDFIIEKAKL